MTKTQEKKILSLRKQGKSIKAIAALLHLSDRTVAKLVHSAETAKPVADKKPTADKKPRQAVQGQDEVRIRIQPTKTKETSKQPTNDSNKVVCQLSLSLNLGRNIVLSAEQDREIRTIIKAGHRAVRELIDDYLDSIGYKRDEDIEETETEELDEQFEV